MGVSFPGIGYDGPADVAVAMFTFPDEESYRRYRESVKAEPECQSAAALSGRQAALPALSGCSSSRCRAGDGGKADEVEG
jgi:hypothetical protein